jgi:hypothetical protein
MVKNGSNCKVLSLFIKHHDIQHNDTQHNDIQQDDTQHNGIKHNTKYNEA